MRAVLVLLSAIGVIGALPSTALAKNGYAILTVGYTGAASRLVTEDVAAVSSINHAPKLGFTVYGGDWYLEVRGTFFSRPSGVAPRQGRELSAHFVPSALGGGEVGVHLPGRAGNLAVALAVDAKTIGLNDAARDGRWLAGGRGVDGGIAVHYAFPVLRRVRFDPAVAAGIGVLGTSGASVTGVWAHGELEAIVLLTDQVSLVAGGGVDFRRYGPDDGQAGFDGRTVRFDLGVAVHDILGIGDNEL